MQTLIRKKAECLANLSIELNASVSVAESCTGGWLSKVLTDLSGSSEWFVGGVVSYSNESKHKLLGVDNSLLDEFGAVSQPVAEAMAISAQRVFSSSLAVSVTGIAGPSGGTADKPVGLVWFGLKVQGKTVRSCCKNFKGNRNDIRQQAVAAALDLLIQSFEA